jgi:hypothetical protein
MLTKLLKALGGAQERTDWESMLTQVGGDSSVWADSDVARSGASMPAGRLVAAPDPNAPDVNLALLGLTGEDVYQRARTIAKTLHHLAQQGATVEQWNLLIRDVTALADMGATVNSLAEVKLRKVTPKIQTVQMLPLMGSILAKRANDLRRSGILLVPELQSYEIDGDPALCRALIETALEWALPFGNRLTVTTELSSWADAARLIIVADHVVRTQEASPPLERTSLFLWELLVELSQAVGVLISRSQVEGKTAVTIEFPLQHKMEGEIASDELRMQTFDAPTLVGMDVLVYATTGSVRLALDKALSRAQCRSRFASGLSHLVRECELHLPGAMILEAELLDENVQSLIDDLRRHLRTFALIEIVKEQHIHEISMPSAGRNCRLSASSIETNLQDAMMFELVQK